MVWNIGVTANGATVNIIWIRLRLHEDLVDGLRSGRPGHGDNQWDQKGQSKCLQDLYVSTSNMLMVVSSP